MSLLKDLIAGNMVNPELLRQPEEPQANLSEFEQALRLVRMNLLEETRLLALLSSRYGIPMLSNVVEEVRPFDPHSFSRNIYDTTHILPVRIGKKCAGLISIYSDWMYMNLVRFQFEEPIKWYLALQQQIQVMLEQAVLPHDPSMESVTERIQKMFEDAIARNASDIHLEPEKELLRVRFRVDGFLQDAETFPIHFHPPFFTRLKLLGGMDIAVRRQPQDGYYAFQAGDSRWFDVRVSTMPGQQGEKLVLRLLDQTPVQHNMEALGFLKDDLKVLHQASLAQNGLIVMVGPTGSGKTTTLYAILHALNSRDKNILTIENPVEYHVEGITQVSVEPEQGFGFADALRAGLRQDPDVILVGEIRDEETAGIAVKAALTGHLVLTTLHSRDAVTAVQRLSNLGVSRDLLAETLTLIVSQRLVRKRCLHKENGKTCMRCRGTGYSGRVPLYEIMRVNQLMRERIRSGTTGHRLVEPASGLYFHSMKKTAERLVQLKLTDWKEVRPQLLQE